MAFIEFEKSVRTEEWSMQDLHSHEHYEIYFLSKGERSFFFSNALYKVSAPMLIILPPYVMHKTEGDAFERYNVNVSPDYLDGYQTDVLQEKALLLIKPNPSQTLELTALFDKAIAVDKWDKHAEHILRALFSYAVYLLQNFEKNNSSPNATAQKKLPALVLKAMDYLHEHLDEKVTLQALADTLFVSKATLLYNFKKYTNCSPIDFLLNVRLTKAKELLSNSKKSVGKIAEECGFTSANYFGLIFKQKEGISPMHYRKNQREKR